MKSIKAFFLMMTIVLTVNVSAQSIGDYIDVIYLKNGNTTKGVMIEQVPGVSVSIKTLEGDIIVYPISDILKFTREEKTTGNEVVEEIKIIKEIEIIENEDDKLRWGDNFKHKKKGYFLEADVLLNSTAAGLRITNGIRFGRFGNIGIAIGIENISPSLFSGYNVSMATVNLVYSGELIDKRITPFYQVEAGYGYAINRHSKMQNRYTLDDYPISEIMQYEGDRLFYGGPMLGLQLGVKFKTKKSIVYKLGLDARIVSSFTDSHSYFEGYKHFSVMASPGLGVRFGIGF